MKPRQVSSLSDVIDFLSKNADEIAVTHDKPRADVHDVVDLLVALEDGDTGD